MSEQYTNPSSETVEKALTAIGWDMAGPEIEQESFRRIEMLCEDMIPRFAPAEWRVARRLVHTTADPEVAKLLRFANGAIEAGAQALKTGSRIYCDAHMIKAGLSKPKLAACSKDFREENILCRSSDPDVVEKAKETGTTRALCAVEKAHALGELEGAVILVGNAPLALAKISKLVLEEGLKPALVVGMPVGFVNVCEAKELLALCPVPQIVLMGRRGGSPLAVATLHALVEVVLDEKA